MSKSITPTAAAVTGKVNPQALLLEVIGTSLKVIEQIDRGVTERAQIRADRDVALAKIDATTRILTQAFESSFEERATVFEGFFSNLTLALKSGDTASAAAILNGIVETAKKSPITDLGNLALIRAQLESGTATFDL